MRNCTTVTVMLRSAFALVLALMLAPLAVEAQQSGRIPRIGYLSSGSVASDEARFAAFRQGLQELGYVEGKSIVIQQRYAAGQPERLPQLAEELVRLQVDVLVVYGGAQGVFIAKKATSSIPIVFTVVADPVGEGVVASLARPGGNVTGLSDLHADLITKRLQLFKELVPSASRIAVLSNSANPGHSRQLKDIAAAAPAFGLTLLSLPIAGADEIDRAFMAMREQRTDGLLILGDPILGAQRGRIAGLAAKSRLPAVFTTREAAEAGGLMSYGTVFPELWRRAATYVHKILKGAKPADLPVEQPTKFELVINLRTAKAVGLTIPSSLLQRADHIIE
jgi:putative ABC transport system substrate-binding protein